MRSLLLFLLLVFSTQLLTVTADIYLQSTNELVYKFNDDTDVVGDTLKLIHNYTKPNGEIIAQDIAYFIDDKLVKGVTKLYPMEQTGEIEFLGEEIRLSFDDQGKKKSKTIDAVPTTIAGPMLNNFIIENWEILFKGDIVKYYLPAPEYLALGRFYLKKIETSKHQTANSVVYKMKPTNIFLKLFIKASYFVYDIDLRRIKAIHGTTILPIFRDGKWHKTSEVDIYFND